MPLMFRKYEDEHPAFARLLLKTGIESLMYKNLAGILGATLSSNKQRARGKPRLGFGELWLESLNKAIDETVTNKTLNKQFKTFANLSLMNDAGEFKPGIRQVSDFFGPLSQAGHIQRAIDTHGKNFKNLSEIEKEKIADNVINSTHRFWDAGRPNPLLSHVTAKHNNPRLFDVHDFKDRTHGEAKEIVKREIMQRINNAQDIHLDKLPPGSLMSLRDQQPSLDQKNVIKESAINALIKKYAKN